MLFHKIVGYFKEKTFEKLYLHIIERLILNLKASKSTKTSVKYLFEDLTSWQKAVFSRFNEFFELKMQKYNENQESSDFQLTYFRELEIILRSSCNVIEQLKAFHQVLRLQHNLRHKSRQAIQQTKAQAIISIFIYIGFVLISKTYLNLEIRSWTMLVSLILFCMGQISIFRLGGAIRWKT